MEIYAFTLEDVKEYLNDMKRDNINDEAIVHCNAVLSDFMRTIKDNGPSHAASLLIEASKTLRD